MDQLFLTAQAWLAGGTALAALGCLLWGVVSVLISPCHLASIPLIVSYVAGQDQSPRTGGGLHYALLFTTGLFTTIAALGVACHLLGRMLGDVGPYWTLAVGAVLLWVALDMLGLAPLNLSGGLMQRLRVRGLGGALALGLAYGVLSGSCTFGFIAPVLAVVAVQESLLTGLLLIVLFGLGHCLPIVVAGSSMALVRRWLENGRMQARAAWLRKAAGLGIAALAVYFAALPFLDS